MDTNQYMEMFLEESREHLQSLNDGLLSLENDPGDLSVLNEIFRNAHTLKGMSATMGYNKIAELTHEMEDVLDLLRKEQLKINEDIIDTIFKCVDSLQEMIESVGNGEAEDVVDVSDLVAKLSSISTGKPVAAKTPEKKAEAAPAAETAAASTVIELSDTEKTVLAQAKESGLRGLHIHVRLADTCLLKSARSYMVMNALDELGDVIKSVPPAEELEQEKFDHTFEVVVVTGEDEKTVKDALLSISELEEVTVTVLGEEKAKAEPAPAKAERFPQNR